MAYVETMVGIDYRYRVPALVDPEGSRWNGWLCPLFPLSSVLALQAALHEESLTDPDAPRIIVDGERVILHDREEQGGGASMYLPTVVAGVPHWAVGERSWMWEPADMDGGE
jgi:hypothetical protein